MHAYLCIYVFTDRALDSIDSPQCGAAYLHVITYNEAAIRFYEANGFKRLRTLQGPCVVVRRAWRPHQSITACPS